MSSTCLMMTHDFDLCSKTFSCRKSSIVLPLFMGPVINVISPAILQLQVEKIQRVPYIAKLSVSFCKPVILDRFAFS